MVRAFVGVTIPEDIKSYVIDIQNQLKSLSIKAKFVEPENFHISLSFLGDIHDKDIEIVKWKLDEICNSYEMFEVVLGDILLIPNEKFVRVIALDLKNEKLEVIRKEIVKNIGGESYPAHLTLARVKTIENKRVFLENIRKISCSRKFEVDNIALIGSVLQKTGPIYTTLYKSNLK